ncbi:MAG: DegT/DnrJ/EryC1/StrS family aminotransferase [Proteobacteria bacterium]|nr:DegT/DnrJ/EryC1/StrS family aminotransferase [Pseudomonadota bacterium]
METVQNTQKRTATLKEKPSKGSIGQKRKVTFGTIQIPELSKRLIAEALETTRISSGKLVRRLEDKFAELVGVPSAVAVSSGTDADVLALAVLHDRGAERGDEVIVPALSFVATGNAVVHAGFKPVFVDIDRETLNIDVSQIEAMITERTRAIMPVHLMGKPADMDAVNAIAKHYNLLVVEDAAEAHGATYKGKAAGTLADLGAFSLYVAHIITTGEGGIITAKNEEDAEILRSLRSHGRSCKCKVCNLSTASKYCAKRFDTEEGEDIRFVFERVGYSCKMNELEAAIGLGNMENYQEIVQKRHQNLLYVLNRFERFNPYLATIREEAHERIGPHAIPIVIQEEAGFTRAQLTNYLEKSGIETRTLFASMPTQCPGFAYLGYREGQFPVAEYMGRNGIHIGVHHDLDLEDMEYVLEVLTRFLETWQN